MATVTAVLKDIQLMPPADQRKVKLALDALVNTSVKSTDSKTETRNTTSEKDAREALFYEALSTVIAKTNRGNTPPFRVFKSSPNYKQFKLAAASVDEYIESLLAPSKVTRIERSQFYTMYAKLVAKDLMRAEIALSINSLTNSVDRFPGILDKSFPGYARNGLFLKLIAKKNFRK